MAEFNKNIVAESSLEDTKYKMECAMMLMSCLTDEDYEALKEDWHKAGGVKVIKWWEFIFNNVSVTYSRDTNIDEEDVETCFCEKCGCDVTYAPCDCPPDGCSFIYGDE